MIIVLNGVIFVDGKVVGSTAEYKYVIKEGVVM